MTMGVVAREEGVLKLVHPGCFVEIHRTPVAASQVMEKNPRHFVTRPDVFKFPWIVVRPESLLMPGKVFYIVPCYTLYQLLRNAAWSPAHHASMMTARPNNDYWTATEAAMDMDFDQEKRPAYKSCLKKKHSFGNSKPQARRRVEFSLPDQECRDGEESFVSNLACYDTMLSFQPVH